MLRHLRIYHPYLQVRKSLPKCPHFNFVTEMFERVSHQYSLCCRIEETCDGRIQDTSGEVLYRVKFKALVMKPFKGEVLEGIVTEVHSNGFMVQSGPLESFVASMVTHHQTFMFDN
jgi:DNA-directed RNA polymerase subunit E'/Rpb7